MDNYSLELLKELSKVHLIFYIKLLKPYIPNDDSKFPSRKNTKPGPLPEFQTEDRYEIEKVLKFKVNVWEETIHYLVK